MTTKLVGFNEQEFKQQIAELAETYESAIRDAEGRSQGITSTDTNSQTRSGKSIQGLTEQQWRESEEYYGY
jgi:hypothetical protein